MSNLITFIIQRIRPLLPRIITALVVFAIVVGLYYLYQHARKTEQEKQLKNIANANPNGHTVSILMFHVDWCPHCKKALPEWRAFCDEYDGKQVGGYMVECKDLDCTESKDPALKSLMDKYKVNQFPTIKGVLAGKDGVETTVDFDAKVTKKNLEQFVISVAST
jgi:thiol-disulfide isomerase/thioredoxin